MIRIFLLGFLSILSLARAQQYIISTVAGGVPPATPTAATTASIGDPPRVAVDSAGNTYFGSIHSVFRVDRAGILTRIAGTGRSGNSGDAGAATNAQLTLPDGIALDAAGNIYVSDRDANVIRKVSAGGIISTIAGTGTAGFSGDGGSAAAAQLNGPTGIAPDSAGNLYIADTNNSRIRRISTAGTIDTIAGDGSFQFGGDGDQARSAQLNGAEGVTVDSAGFVYIADTFNNRVRRINLDGVMITFAGNGFPGYSGEKATATDTTLFLPTDVAVDASGNVYIADLGTIRIRVVTKGIINTVAGSSSGIPPQDGELAVSVRLDGPTGVAVDSGGAVYFAEGSIGSGSGLDAGDFRVWKVTTDGTLHVLAGTGQNSFSGDGGPASSAQVNRPSGVAMDSFGNLYVADTANNRVRRISPGGAIDTVVGFGPAGFSGDGGPAVSALLNQPTGVAVDSTGNLYIADTGNNRIRFVNLQGTIGTLAGNGNAGLFGDGGSAQAAALHAPRGVAVDSAGNVYIADTLDHRVREVTTDGVINTVAGRGQGFSGDGGPAVNAQLNLPTAVAVDAAGLLYIADQANGRIRKVSALGNITTVAGGGSTNGPGDGGPAVNAQLIAPQGLAVDRLGNLYVADSGENRLRKVTIDGQIATIAGTGQCCYANDGGPGTSALLNQPWGVTLDSLGDVFFADSGNNAIRLLQPLSSNPGQGTVTNAASNLTGPVAPGEIVAIFGAGLGPAQPASNPLNGAGLVGTVLGGVSVLFNGTFGPVLYASATQVTAIVPYGVAGQNVQVVVENQSLIPLSTSVPLASSAPALFTANASGRGQAAASNADGSANSAANPAAPGSVISLFATGEGQTSPSGVDGLPASNPVPRPILSVSVTINGQPAAVQSAGEALQKTGVMQVQVQIPNGVAGGAVPVVLQVGGASSQPGVTIAIAGS